MTHVPIARVSLLSVGAMVDSETGQVVRRWWDGYWEVSVSVGAVGLVAVILPVVREGLGGNEGVEK